MTFADLAWYAMVEQTVTDLYREELGRDPDPSGRGNLVWMARELGHDADALRAFLRNSDEWHERHDPRPLPPVPVVDRAVLKGAFCIPTHTRIWWPAFLSVDEAEQDRYIRETVARGYTFGQVLVSGLPYGETDYREIAPDAGRLRAGLEKMKAAGLVTIIATDDRRGPDLGYLRDVLVPNRDLIDWSMWVYECNGVFKDRNAVLSMLRQGRELLPDALSAVHFESLDEGTESYGLVDWRRAKSEAGLNALFFQTAGWHVGVEEATARIHDFTRRLMGGFHGYPILSHGVYDYENTTSKTYRGLMSEAQAVSFTDAMMNAPLVKDEGFAAIRPSGFNDGGTP